MPYNPSIHHRRSIRLKGHDYTQPAAYFVTLCTHEWAHLSGKVVDGAMQLNECSEIVCTEWFQTAVVRPYYEHIIRTDRALNAIRRYIADNPRRWHLDRKNIQRIGDDPLAQEIWDMLQQDDDRHNSGNAP